MSVNKSNDQTKLHSIFKFLRTAELKLKNPLTLTDIIINYYWLNWSFVITRVWHQKLQLLYILLKVKITNKHLILTDYNFCFICDINVQISYSELIDK